jgi:hypothetical protein
LANGQVLPAAVCYPALFMNIVLGTSSACETDIDDLDLCSFSGCNMQAIFQSQISRIPNVELLRGMENGDIVNDVTTEAGPYAHILHIVDEHSADSER